MRAKPAVLGVAAAAAFSSAAFAAPCPQKAAATSDATVITSNVDDKLFSGSPGAERSVVAAESATVLQSAVSDAAASTFPADRSNRAEPVMPKVAPFIEITMPAAEPTSDTGVGGDETFSGKGIKITNLQATMTSNTYVASPFAPATKLYVTDNLKMYGPDYFSVRAMSPLPKRRPSVVGVGLVTVPSPKPKKPDTAQKNGPSATPDQK